MNICQWCWKWVAHFEAVILFELVQKYRWIYSTSAVIGHKKWTFKISPKKFITYVKGLICFHIDTELQPLANLLQALLWVFSVARWRHVRCVRISVMGWEFITVTLCPLWGHIEKRLACWTAWIHTKASLAEVGRRKKKRWMDKEEVCSSSLLCLVNQSGEIRR